MRDVFIGIAPWLDGAVAFFEIKDGAIELALSPVPLLHRPRIDYVGLAQIFRGYEGARVYAFIEKELWLGESQRNIRYSDQLAQARAHAALRCCLAVAGIEWTDIEPADWRRALVPEKRWHRGGGGINVVQPAFPTQRNRAYPYWRSANRLFPGCEHLWPLKKHGYRAAAALIGLYGAAELGKPWARALIGIDLERPDRAVRPPKGPNLHRGGRPSRPRTSACDRTERTCPNTEKSKVAVDGAPNLPRD